MPSAAPQDLPDKPFRMLRDSNVAPSTKRHGNPKEPDTAENGKNERNDPRDEFVRT
jgi:hypothetical protein